MAKQNQIKILVLSLVYIGLLLSVILPHHHHEELACFTATHCEDDRGSHEDIANEIDDHHHDQQKGGNSEQCFTIDYYIVSDAGKNLKQVYIPVFIDHGQEFILACTTYCKEENLISAENSETLILDSDSYIVYLTRNIPLRAPPSNLV